MRGYLTIVAVLFSVLLLTAITGCVSASKKASPEEVAEANVNLSSEYFRMGRLVPALETAKKAIRADAESVTANLLLALIYQKLEQTPKAEEFFLSAVEFVEDDDVEFGIIHNNYAVFLCQQGQYLDAEEHFLLAIKNKLYRTPEKAYENAGICSLKRGKKALAEQYFRNAILHSPIMAKSLLELAKTQYDAGAFLSSRGYIQRYHDLRRGTAKSLFLEIKIELKLNAASEADRLINDLIQRFPDSPEAKIVKK